MCKGGVVCEGCVCVLLGRCGRDGLCVCLCVYMGGFVREGTLSVYVCLEGGGF